MSEIDVRSVLEQLEGGTAGDDELAAPLAFLAAQAIDLDASELHAARRRALLLLASGGDPRRELDAGGRAARSLAADLETPERTERLHAALARAREQASGLPHVGAAADFLMREPDAAWRWVALALLAEELTGEA